MSDLLLDKVAVVTGSNRGIGKSILEKFAENKAEVFACARKENTEFKNYCSELSNKYIYICYCFCVSFILWF